MSMSIRSLGSKALSRLYPKSRHVTSYQGSPQKIPSQSRSSEEVNLVILYSDDSEESEKAEQILREKGVLLHVEHGKPGYGERYPLAIFQAWPYEGIPKILILLKQMEFARERDKEKTLKQSR